MESADAALPSLRAALRLIACERHARARSHNPEVAGSNPAPATREAPANAGVALVDIPIVALAEVR